MPTSRLPGPDAGRGEHPRGLWEQLTASSPARPPLALPGSDSPPPRGWWGVAGSRPTLLLFAMAETRFNPEGPSHTVSGVPRGLLLVTPGAVPTHRSISAPRRAHWRPPHPGSVAFVAVPRSQRTPADTAPPARPPAGAGPCRASAVSLPDASGSGLRAAATLCLQRRRSWGMPRSWDSRPSANGIITAELKGSLRAREPFYLTVAHSGAVPRRRGATSARAEPSAAPRSAGGPPPPRMGPQRPELREAPLEGRRAQGEERVGAASRTRPSPPEAEKPAPSQRQEEPSWAQKQGALCLPWNP